MPTRTLDGQIDRLYQLPLDEFTSARNALAKELGKEGGEVRSLPKPPAAAWAINQLYWSRRPVFDALVAAATALRGAHRQVLAGKRADLRAAGSAHEEALEAALKGTLAILANADQPASDVTKQAIVNTLRALPVESEAPGRLTRTLQPGGFELLAGLPIAAGTGAPARKPQPQPPPSPAPAQKRATSPADREQTAQRGRVLAKAQEAVTAAVRLEKTAEQTAKREEFEAARAARDADRAATRLADAQSALHAAQEKFDEAQQALDAATRKKEAATRRARETADTLARARVRTEASRAELARLNR
jgi:hypothetical protein